MCVFFLGIILFETITSEIPLSTVDIWYDFTAIGTIKWKDSGEANKENFSSL